MVHLSPGDLGDAHNWNNRAQYRDYQVSHTPKRHAAVVFEAGQFGADQHYGHVAFVEKLTVMVLSLFQNPMLKD